METIISHKLFFEQSAGDVWQYLTNSDLMELWLMKNDFRPIIGHQFRFLSRPMPEIGFDGIIYCTVLEVIESKRLSYSWRCGPGEGRITLDSTVVWTLHPKNNGTELHLEHNGYRETELFSLYALMDAGWLKNIHKIRELLNTATDGTNKA